MTMRKAEPPTPAETSEPPITPHRLFLYEPGWRVGLKVGSEKTFCYMMKPGQDYYHRLLDGEIYLYNNEERICFACAVRRGLISDQPRGLSDARAVSELDAPEHDRGSPFDLAPPPHGEDR
jgi:hypothetical protein